MEAKQFYNGIVEEEREKNCVEVIYGRGVPCLRGIDVCHLPTLELTNNSRRNPMHVDC